MAAMPLTQTNETMHDTKVIPFVLKNDEKEVKLKKDGAPKKISHNKQKYKKSEVYALQPEDAKKIVLYLRDNEMWIHYMIFVLGCNMGRRVSDTMALKWSDVFDVNTGSLKSHIEIKEKKTQKYATIRLNSACREAIQLYIEKTGCDPSKDNYSVNICMQLSGTHPGNVLSYDAYYKVIKKAQKTLKIKYNIGTHSTRKMFGMITMKLHPGDNDCINVLQQMFNHSDMKTTNRYIGTSQETFDQYSDDFGEFFSDHIIGDKEYVPDNDFIIHIKSSDLRFLLNQTYEMALENAGSTDAMVHVDAYTELMNLVDQLKK